MTSTCSSSCPAGDRNMWIDLSCAITLLELTRRNHGFGNHDLYGFEAAAVGKGELAVVVGPRGECPVDVVSAIDGSDDERLG